MIECQECIANIIINIQYFTLIMATLISAIKFVEQNQL